MTLETLNFSSPIPHGVHKVQGLKVPFYTQRALSATLQRLVFLPHGVHKVRGLKVPFHTRRALGATLQRLVFPMGIIFEIRTSMLLQLS